MRSKFVLAILAAVVLLAPAVSAQAFWGNPIGARGSKFARQHPRRNEVNKRIANQRGRIHQGAKSGRLTPTQATQLRADDRTIKRQEHADVRTNGGYLTKPEQRQLNQEENADSRLIRDEKHPAAP